MTLRELALPCCCHPFVSLPWNINATNHKRQPGLEPPSLTRWLEDVSEQGWDMWWLCASPQSCVLLPETGERLNPPLKVGRWKGRAARMGFSSCLDTGSFPPLCPWICGFPLLHPAKSSLAVVSPPLQTPRVLGILELGRSSCHPSLCCVRN